jgi:hypothetical protein
MTIARPHLSQMSARYHLDLIAPDGRKADSPACERGHYLREMQQSAHGRDSPMATKRNNQFGIALKLFMVTVVSKESRKGSYK